MSQPVVSVIIPIYKVERYIEKCSRSLFEQSLKEGIEFIFVDDATPDKSIEILQTVLADYPERKSQVKILHHASNKGLAAARNTGYATATGEYIIHCDSDDYVHPDMYKILTEKAYKESADVVICDFYAAFENRNLLFKQEVGTNKKSLISGILDGSIHNGVWNKLIHRNLYSKLDTKWCAGVNMWEDVSIIPRLLYFSEKTVRIVQPLYYYNLSNSSSYIKQYSEKAAKQIHLASDIVCKFFQSVDVSKIYKDDIITFRHRTLNKILLRTVPAERKKWINIYKDLQHQPIPPRMNLADKIIYRLFLKNHFRAGELVISLRNVYSKLRSKI